MPGHVLIGHPDYVRLWQIRRIFSQIRPDINCSFSTIAYRHEVVHKDQLECATILLMSSLYKIKGLLTIINSIAFQTQR